jgi:hypothetical protein
MNPTLRLISAPLVLVISLVAVRAAAAPDAPWTKGPFECYAVPPLSSILRLPDSIPSDARLSSELRIVAAQGEFEPASFVIVPRADVAKLELAPTSLVGPGGEIPASAVDIKIVKTWYQGGTAWYSYFADSNRKELVPELLLNDETLVKVDEAKKENYLRVGGEYQWISGPKEKGKKPFNQLLQSVGDSPKLLPVGLQKGKNKQIWVTVKIPAQLAGGIYRGKIAFTADGKPAGAMDLVVRVLPFQLPMPKTYYNLENDFLVTLYGTSVWKGAKEAGLSQEAAEKLQMNIYKDLLEHNIFNCRSDLDIRGKRLQKEEDKAKNYEESAGQLTRELELMKKAGFTMKPLLSLGWSYPNPMDPLEIPKDSNVTDAFKKRIDLLAKTLKAGVGHDDIYVATWDEATADRVKIMRDVTEYTNTQGLKLWATTAKGKHFELAGYIIDYANHGGWPQREIAEQWHAVGAKVTSYAGPHTGPENPDVFRRWEGLARYKAYYDGSFNYQYYSGWNDFDGDAFRQFNLVYPTTEGVIDTLAWEGFREGIDDIRYATKLKQEAQRAIASGNVKAMHAAKKALMWLELLDDKTADLSAARAEIIEYILKIQAAMQEKGNA